jgi:uridylate kinase
MAFNRVLLKISGEALGDPQSGHGFDPVAVQRIAKEIAQAAQAGVHVALVVGGGNILRGAAFSSLGTNRASADYMGMLGTVINGIAVTEAIEAHGVEARLMSALTIPQVAELFVRRRALRHLEKGRVVVLAGGTGNPFFTTDTAAALRASELGCQVLLKATKVDGVYSSDPKRDRSAQRFERLDYMEVLQRGLKVMDATAITLCMEKQLPVIVFDMFIAGNIGRVIQGESLGTRIG